MQIDAKTSMIVLVQVDKQSHFQYRTTRCPRSSRLDISKPHEQILQYWNQNTNLLIWVGSSWCILLGMATFWIAATFWMTTLWMVAFWMPGQPRLPGQPRRTPPTKKTGTASVKAVYRFAGMHAEIKARIGTWLFFSIFSIVVVFFQNPEILRHSRLKLRLVRKSESPHRLCVVPYSSIFAQRSILRPSQA